MVLTRDTSGDLQRQKKLSLESESLGLEKVVYFLFVVNVANENKIQEAFFILWQMWLTSSQLAHCNIKSLLQFPIAPRKSQTLSLWDQMVK